MPQTNNSKRSFTQQDGRIQVTSSGNMVLLPQGHQFRSMSFEQLQEVDTDSLSDMETEAYVNRVRHLMEQTELRCQRLQQASERQAKYIKKYGN